MILIYLNREKYKAPKIKMPERVGTKFCEDPSSQRIGWILEDEVTNTILQACSDAKNYISPKKVELKEKTIVDELFRHLDLLKAGLAIAYPGDHGLPEWEPVLCLFYDKEDILNKEEPNTDYIKCDTALMWCAGKEYEREKFLSEYVGKNEKTKIVIIL